ncbi:hypothetical protein BD626DRAFT_510389 [Schizophyllum amplum]|uniref:Uncharacterized protein n=1 Tax=Schizophyllum amplum TaxID=97359 RepID=A0A550C1Q6_9AGAR|nr:hypothetical protein BD626DRAFT_510389 [Auriculariopsis ampla]
MRQRTFKRLYPPACALTKEPLPDLNEASHALDRSLERTKPDLFRSLQKAFGKWCYIGGAWKQCLNLDFFGNIELLSPTMHVAYDGRKGIGSGRLGYVPLKPSLDECVSRIYRNREFGQNLEELFPEPFIEYGVIVLGNNTISAAVYDGEPREYPIPDLADPRRQLYADKLKSGYVPPAKLVTWPDDDFVFPSHLNPCLVITNLRLKLEYWYGPDDSPRWDDATEAERDLYEQLTPGTDYLFDANSWDGPPPPPAPSKTEETTEAVRRSARVRGMKTEGSVTKIPKPGSKLAFPAKVHAPKPVATMAGRPSREIRTEDILY